MGLSRQHEMHRRRFGRNLGLGLVLGGLVALVFGLTVAKVGVDGFELRTGDATGSETATGARD